MAEATAGKQTREGQNKLQAGLKRRHMTMISLGGIIGAGLFVGTGPILNQAGPATILTYALTGGLLILIMRMLGEMAVARPSVGSFSDYGRMALGNWAGFAIGWLYWYFWAIVVGFEATVAAGILGQYIPGIPPWVMALALLLLLTATNLYSVGSYGEFEFWFAGIKVVAILIFIGLAALFVIGLWPGGSSPGLTNLYAEGGFFPNGPLAMFSGVATVIFAFVGAEIVTIAAAESDEPGRNVARATNAVIYRVLIFYVISVFFVAAIVPWDTGFTDDVLKSPFTLAFGEMGIPYAPLIMNLVVLTAVLSVLNSSLYTTSRMLFALTRHNDAPGFLTNTTRRGVPIWAILAGTVFAYVSVAIFYFFPEDVFTWLINASGAIALFVYLLIAVSQLVMRRRLERDNPELLQLRMWFYPWLTYLSIFGILAVLIAMFFIEGLRPQIIASLISLGVILVAYFLRRAFGPPQRAPDAVINEETTARQEAARGN
ncbi:MAG: Aromatic amino acid transport protein AroP [uncultured Rubrobacteraceae bacterium]|uniref:Aromatic amino acid transport protein AroP n=1 Tax=uncultured Rubrobacteraceae bacterium TaxID=349277 RepID=A0A6J4RTN4_9ACTN|nr:MAG: Aromatic amino acid transport protein AroP [uncultured Rubrobacteraceae bacterium]